MGTQTTVPCAQGEDSGLLGLVAETVWAAMVLRVCEGRHSSTNQSSLQQVKVVRLRQFWAAMVVLRFARTDTAVQTKVRVSLGRHGSLMVSEGRHNSRKQ